MSLESTFTKTIPTIPECVAAGYVDIESGMLLAVKTVDSHPAEVLNLVAAATADLFQGPNVSMIERMFNKSRGIPEGATITSKSLSSTATTCCTSSCVARSTRAMSPCSSAASRPTSAWR